MSDLRRTILWVVLGFSLMMLWDRWLMSQGHSPWLSSGPASSVKEAKVEGASLPTSPSEVPRASVSAPIAGASVMATPVENRVSSQTYAIQTDVFDLVFDAQGGNLVGATLRQHPLRTGLKPQEFEPMVLMKTQDQRVYMAQTGLIGQGLPHHKTPMKMVSHQTQLQEGQKTLQVRFESEPTGGVVLSKTYTLQKGSYMIGLKQEVRNVGASSIKAQAYVQLVRDAHHLESETPFYQTFTGPAIYSEEKKFQKIQFEDIHKQKTDFVAQTSNGYLAMVQHYFATAWILPSGTPRENFVRDLGQGVYSVGAVMGLHEMARGESQVQEMQLYVGPQEETRLQEWYPGLELVKDYGWVTLLAKPLYGLLAYIHQWVGNWGWAIVLLVVLIKAAFYWLNAAAYRSMGKMKAVQPRIQEMRERLKDEPRQMQMEMMKIYREEKINPLGGCLPILIQIPVFIALYWVLLSSVEMRNAPFMGWITDLSTKDPYYILPLLMTVTTVFQTALNPTPPDPLQAKLMWIMPLAFSVMFFFFPSGLVLYWITNNVLTIAQQWHINHRMGVRLQFNLPRW